jgi:hypothetical protein
MHHSVFVFQLMNYLVEADVLVLRGQLLVHRGYSLTGRTPLRCEVQNLFKFPSHVVCNQTQHQQYRNQCQIQLIRSEGV